MKKYLTIFLLFYKVCFASQLDDLISFAEKNSPKLKEFNHQKNINSLKQSYILSLPNPKLYVGFSNFEINKPYLSSNNPMGSFLIGLSQEYPLPIKRYLDSQIVSKENELIDLNRTILERQLKRQIKENYADFIFSFRKEEVINQQLDLYKKYKKIFEENYKYGKVQLKDILSLDVKVLETQKILEEISKEREIVKNQIFYLIGGDYPLNDDKTFYIEDFSEKSDVDDSVYIKQIEIDIEKTEKEIQRSKVEYLPNLEFMGEYMYRKGLPDMFTFKISITLPVFKSKKEDLIEIQKKEEKLIKQLQLENEKLRIKNLFHTINITYNKNKQIIEIYEKILREKENQIKAIELSLKYGKAEPDEILKTLEEIFQIKLMVLDLKLENLKLRFKLEEIL